MVSVASSFSLTYDHKDTDCGQLGHTLPHVSDAISYSFLLSLGQIINSMPTASYQHLLTFIYSVKKPGSQNSTNCTATSYRLNKPGINC